MRISPLLSCRILLPQPTAPLRTVKRTVPKRAAQKRINSLPGAMIKTAAHNQAAAAHLRKAAAKERPRKTTPKNPDRKQTESLDLITNQVRTKIVKAPSRIPVTRPHQYPTARQRKITPRWITMTYRLSKIMSVLCIAVVLMLACAVIVTAGSSILGDADNDGQVTPIDASIIQRDLAGLPINGEISQSGADVDGNGKIEITDATLIQRWIAGIDTPYQIGPQSTEAPTQQPTDEDGWGTIIYRP